MFKKIICCITAIVLLISAVIPASIISLTAADSTAASGDFLLYSFDDITDVAASKWSTRWDNGGTAIELSVESNAANAYGGSGKSLKVVYDTANKGSDGNPPTIWLGENAIVPKGEGITFWIKSEKATQIRLVAADKSYANLLTYNAVQINAGENLLFFKYSDFNNADKADWSKINQFQIRTDKADANTFYLDNFGFFGEAEEEDGDNSDTQKQPEAAAGGYLIYSFDSVTDVASSDWSTRWDNGGTAIELAIESNAANAYGGSGKSLKVVYDTSKKGSDGNPPTFWLGENKLTPQGDGFTFWIKSEKDTQIRVVAADKSYSTTLSYNAIEIKAGENLIFLKYSDFTNSSKADWSRINQFQIRADKSDANTLYFDNFGYFDSVDDEEEKEETVDVKPLYGATELLWDFDLYEEISDMKNEWGTHLAGTNGAGVGISLETDTDNTYGGVGKSLKVVYDRTVAGTNTLPCIRNNTNLTGKDEGFVFWMKSAEATKIYFVAVDKNNATIKTDPIDIAEGENTVVVKYSDFKLSSGTGTPDTSVIKQFQVRPAGSNKTGTYWFDAFGYWSEPIVHEADFYEYAIDNTKWTKNSTSQVTLTPEEKSFYYHSGETDAKENTEALKISYKDLSTSNTNSFYYNNVIRISEQEPYIYGEDSVLSFWIYSEQEIKLDVLYSDKNAENENVMSKTKSFVVPAGQSILRLPMSELVKDGTAPLYAQVYQLQFRIFSSSGTKDASKGNIWIDAIGFYDSNPDINTEKQTLSDKVFVWWNFDGYDDISDCQWTTRWEGSEGKGINISMDSDPANTYGGSGKSLKVNYKCTESDNGQPCIWLGDTRMAMYGKGISFWIKSENQTKIRLVGLDADGNTVVTDHIPLKIGENIVTFTWDDFYVSGNKEKAVNMASVMQLQIRPTIKDENTYWIDSVGFYDITDDGSNAYYSICPPDSYEDWYDGVSVLGDDFEKYPGDDDMQFCCDWYFDSTGWIALENIAGNSVFRMDYDFTTDASSVLTNITQFSGVDPNGGISFWAKSSEERYYSLKIWLGNNTVANVVFKASPEGKNYKIPFSAFWLNNKININYSPADKSTISVPKMTIISDETCNPPAVSGSDKFSLWLDDIKFVDSASLKRAGAVDHYENGVRLKADEEGFSVGVYPSIKIETVNEEQKNRYLSAMKGSKTFGKLYQIDAFDANGVSAIPAKAVELTFDIPKGIDPDSVNVYQLFVDGSVAKRSTSVTEDGKVLAKVYKLGSYIVGYGDAQNSENITDTNNNLSSDDGAISDNLSTTYPQTNDSVSDFAILAAVVMLLSLLAVIYGGIYLGRKEKGDYEK